MTKTGFSDCAPEVSTHHSGDYLYCATHRQAFVHCQNSAVHLVSGNPSVIKGARLVVTRLDKHGKPTNAPFDLPVGTIKMGEVQWKRLRNRIIRRFQKRMRRG